MAKSDKTEKQTERTEIVKPETAGAIQTYDFGEDAGKGYEYQSERDSKLPWMTQLQPTSPVIVEGKHGAKPGDWFNTVTEEIYDRDVGFIFVPGTTRHYYAKWIPREKDGGPKQSSSGGSFKGHLEIDDPIVAQAIKESTEFGKYFATIDGVRLQLRETFYVHGAMCTENGDAEGWASIAFWSTKIKAYRAWTARCRGLFVKTSRGDKVPPPLWSHLTRITSKMTSNSQGTFAVPIVRPANGLAKNSILQASDERYQMAKQVAMMVNKGEADIDYERQEAQGTDETPRPFD